MGVDFRMVIRKRVLENHLPMFRIENGICYFDTKDTKRYKKAGRYVICGLWYEGMKSCSKSHSPCIFFLGRTKRGEIATHHKNCPHADNDQKIRMNILSEKRIIRLIGYAHIQSKW
jgi:hypothetical protein